MDDYYGFAAFFAQIGRKQGEDYRQLVVFNAGEARQTIPSAVQSSSQSFLAVWYLMLRVKIVERC